MLVNDLDKDGLGRSRRAVHYLCISNGLVTSLHRILPLNQVFS